MQTIRKKLAIASTRRRLKQLWSDYKKASGLGEAEESATHLSALMDSIALNDAGDGADNNNFCKRFFSGITVPSTPPPQETFDNSILGGAPAIPAPQRVTGTPPSTTATPL